MFEADADPAGFDEPLPGDAASERSAPVLLEPLRPAPGSTIQEVPGEALSFDWRVDVPGLEAAYPGKRLRTDFCMRVTGDTSGFFVMLAVPCDRAGVTLPFDEIRLKLGPKYGRLARVPVRWSLILSLATGGPLFTSKESELILLAREVPFPGGRRQGTRRA